MSELEEFRKAKDDYFKTGPGSPLTAEQKKVFKGLQYFPENRALVFDLQIERYREPEHVRMQTSTGSTQDYKKIGQVRFQVDGTDAVLQVYESIDQPGSYFIPFVDATAPQETYGAGRYLEPEEIHADELHVDFNYAYNPYCAYNDMWSCPFPPPENRLNAAGPRRPSALQQGEGRGIRIEAGEKKFHE